MGFIATMSAVRGANSAQLIKKRDVISGPSSHRVRSKTWGSVVFVSLYTSRRIHISLKVRPDLQTTGP